MAIMINHGNIDEDDNALENNNDNYNDGDDNNNDNDGDDNRGAGDNDNAGAVADRCTIFLCCLGCEIYR